STADRNRRLAGYEPGQEKHEPGWRRATIRVNGSQVRFSVEGLPPVEHELSSQASPWLVLRASHVDQPVARNLRITGAATVPREVPLVEGDKLTGWNTVFYQQDVPDLFEVYNTRSTGPPKLDWTAAGGVLTGKHDPS